VKRLFVCLIVACVSLSPAQGSLSRLDDRAAPQHLVKFSGTLTDTHRWSTVGTVPLQFMMYEGPSGGAAYWQETQNVRPDADGHYTVLLGETTPGGLPGDVFAPGKERWLGVHISGQPEQPRIRLSEIPSTWEADPIDARAPINERASSPTERYLALIVLIMFLGGVALAYSEVVKWWNARMEQCLPPPFANLITYIRESGTRWRATQVLWFPLPHLRPIPRQLQSSAQSVEEDRPKNAA
jgi:hypothetical protein